MKGMERDQIDYVILGNASRIILEGDRVPGYQKRQDREAWKLIIDTLRVITNGKARFSISERVNVLNRNGLLSDDTIPNLLANVPVDDPAVEKYEVVTEWDVVEDAAATVGGVLVETESTSDPGVKSRLKRFVNIIAEEGTMFLAESKKRALGIVAVVATVVTACSAKIGSITPEPGGVGTQTKEFSTQTPGSTDTAEAPTNTATPTRVPIPDIFYSLPAGATATPSGDGKTWNIDLGNGNMVEDVDPKKDVKIDSFGVLQIYDSKGFFEFVYDPGIGKLRDANYVEGKGWIKAEDISPFDTSTFPEAYKGIYSSPENSTPQEQADYQNFLDSERAKFLDTQGLTADVEAMGASGKISPEQVIVFGIFEYIQKNLAEIQKNQTTIVLGPKEIQTSVVLENQKHFDQWQETWNSNGIRYAWSFGWESKGGLAPWHKFQKLTIFGVDVPEKYDNSGSSGILVGIGRVDDNPDSIILSVIAKDKTGNWALILRSASFDSSFHIPKGTICQFSPNSNAYSRDPLTEDVPFGPLERYGKPWARKDVWKALGTGVDSDQLTGDFGNWMFVKSEENTVCFYPFGIYMTGDINLPDLPSGQRYVFFPWGNTNQ